MRSIEPRYSRPASAAGHEVLASPPRAHGRREHVPLAPECAREEERYRELKEASSKDPDKAAEDPEDHVAGQTNENASSHSPAAAARAFMFCTSSFVPQEYTL